MLNEISVYVAGRRVLHKNNDVLDVTRATDTLHANINATRPHGREEKERERHGDAAKGTLEGKKVLTEETANSGRMVGLWIMFGFSRRQVAFSLARAASDLILIMS